jgi:hypothetical protein
MLRRTAVALAEAVGPAKKKEPVMNYGRVASAAVAATVADAVYGFLVYGTLLAGDFEKYPAVFRSAQSGQAYLPLMFACLFVAIFAATVIYAKGYEGGSGVTEGVRFGIVLGVLVTSVFAGVNYAILEIGRRLAVYLAAAGFFEWAMIGIVIGLVYKPASKK